MQAFVEYGNSGILRFRDDLYHRIVLSVDLGKRKDHTAFVLTECKREIRRNMRGKRFYAITSTVRNVRQFPLGIGYDKVAEMIHKEYWDERLRLRNPDSGKPIGPTLLVDVGGVGDAVGDELKKDLGVPFVRYRLVRGTALETRHGKLDYTVPRTVMFQQLYAAFQSDRILIDKRLKGAKILLNELKGLQVEQNEETGYVRVTHRENEHDDLAISLAAANWWANRKLPQGMRYVLTDDTIVDSVHGVVRKGSQYPQILGG